jgi:predicted CXXCH cytochrome family protein
MVSAQVRLFTSPGRYARLLTVVLFSLAAAGCSQQAGHQLLTFFFTGVPPLEEQQTEQTASSGTTPVLKEQRSAGAARQPSDKKQKSAAPGQQDAVPIVPEAPRLYSHTVWAEGDCSPCHEGSGVFGFQPVGKLSKSSSPKLFNSGGGMPGKLRRPEDKICTTCHTDKTGLWAIKNDLWLHNPTARGECLACHDAHQSKQRGVLRSPPEQLCQPCHPAEKMAAIPMHPADSESCLSCHNPHMGKDRHILTKEYREVKQPARREPQVVK